MEVPATAPVTTGEGDWSPAFYKPKAEDFKLKGLFFGPPGVGKTTLACSAADCAAASPAVLINIEGGLLSVLDKMTNIDVIDYTTLKDLTNTLWFLAKSKHQYKTLIIDSLSELQTVNLEAIVRSEVQAKRNVKRTSVDDIWQEDYGTSTSQLRRIVRAFRDLPMHVLVTCHDALTTAEGVTKVHPALTPKLRQSVVGYMDVVGYLFVKEQGDEKEAIRRLLVQPMGKFEGPKDRTPGSRLGVYMDNPSIDGILAAIRGAEPVRAKK